MGGVHPRRDLRTGAGGSGSGRVGGGGVGLGGHRGGDPRIEERLVTAIRQAGGGWEGAAADATRDGLTPLGRWATDAAGDARLTATGITAQGEQAAWLRNAMPSPSAPLWDEPSGRPASDPLYLLEDAQALEQKGAEDAAQAVHLMNTYTSNSYDNIRLMNYWTLPPTVTVETAGGGGPVVTGSSAAGAGAGPPAAWQRPRSPRSVFRVRAGGPAPGRHHHPGRASVPTLGAGSTRSDRPHAGDAGVRTGLAPTGAHQPWRPGQRDRRCAGVLAPRPAGGARPVIPGPSRHPVRSGRDLVRPADVPGAGHRAAARQPRPGRTGPGRGEPVRPASRTRPVPNRRSPAAVLRQPAAGRPPASRHRVGPPGGPDRPCRPTRGLLPADARARPPAPYRREHRDPTTSSTTVGAFADDRVVATPSGPPSAIRRGDTARPVTGAGRCHIGHRGPAHRLPEHLADAGWAT